MIRRSIEKKKKHTLRWAQKALQALVSTKGTVYPESSNKNNNCTKLCFVVQGVGTHCIDNRNVTDNSHYKTQQVAGSPFPKSRRKVICWQPIDGELREAAHKVLARELECPLELDASCNGCHCDHFKERSIHWKRGV
ncbi:hypothetical protein TSUD_270740 [Trifolium subterraneum]|uniref:Uncharacterized protein n=1 Tax=Trifolium subterraneum TaxID=3900 RepID=A0A2Z6NJQ7_TRISU|nr:hypothetical protein TSUD_270740 [Trifolium subterraneum]